MDLGNAFLGTLFMVGPALVLIVLGGLMWAAFKPIRPLGLCVMTGVTILIAVVALGWVLGSSAYLEEHFPLTDYKPEQIKETCQ